jgi:DNA-binding MarR family transcriptional regulator
MDSIPINDFAASPDAAAAPELEEGGDDARLRASMARNAAAFGSSPDEARSIRLMASLRRTSNLFQRRVDAHGRPHDLSLGRANVLLALHGSPDGRLPLHAVAATLDVTRGNVSNLVQSLTDDGFVANEPDPDDGRSILVKLTPAGRIALRDYIPTHYALVARLCEGLTTEQKEQLIGLLDALRTSARAKG